MSDLIKKSDAIKALYKYNFVSKDVIEQEINAIPSAGRSQGEWIPVSERLPRNNGWYLVTIRGYETVTDVSLYSADGSAWSDVSTKQKVIAWMPLPEPYDCGSKMKGGEDE